MAGVKAMTRKERRKEERQFKKWRKNAFHRGQKVPGLEEYKKQKEQAHLAEQKEEKKRKDKARKKLLKKRRTEKRKQEKLDKEREAKEKIEEEEKELQKLEKCLKLRKGARSKAFQNDQLDYLLDFQEDAELFKKAYEKGATLPINFNDQDAVPYLKEHGSEDSEDEEDEDDYEDEEEDEDDLGDGFFEQTDEGTEDEEDEADSAAQDIQVFSEPDPRAGKSILKRGAPSDSVAAAAAPPSKRLKWEEAVGESESNNEDNEDVEAGERSHESSEEMEDEGSSEEMEDEGSSEEKEGEGSSEEKEDEGSSQEIEDEESSQEIEDEESSEEKEDEGSSEEMADEGSSEEMNDEEKGQETEEASTALKEDIYGRLRDAEGRVVTGGTGKYIPPAKRALLALPEDKGRAARLEALRKNMKGLINRANDGNIQSIANDIEEMYRKNSRSDVNETFYGLVCEAVVAKSLTPEHIVNVLSLLIAILHGNVGSEVGAFFIQRLATKWSQLIKAEGREKSKEVDNVILLISSLYNFRVIGHEVIYDLMNKAVEAFGEKDIETLVLMLRTCGFALRKASPLQLKEVIGSIQSKAGQVDTSSFEDPSRVRWLLDILLAIRNNNVRKMPNYNPEGLERLKKLARQYIRGGNLGDDVLRVSLEDLLQAELSGKWWAVGSAWQGRTPAAGASQPGASQNTESAGKFKAEVLKLARKQKMTSEPRKTIFCVVMSSKNVIHAHQNLKQLGLNKSQEGDMLAVILDCAQQCKQYNHYFSLLLQALAQDDRELKWKLKLLWWDKLSELGRLAKVSRQNLAQTLAHLLLHSIVNLAVFKKLQFGMLDKPSENFICSVLKSVLTTESKRTVRDIFQEVSKDVGQGLLFLMEKRFSKTVDEDALLYDRVQYVCTMLGAFS